MKFKVWVILGTAPRGIDECGCIESSEFDDWDYEREKRDYTDLIVVAEVDDKDVANAIIDSIDKLKPHF